MTTDMSEAGLEGLIVEDMTAPGLWTAGNPRDYNRDYCVDTAQLNTFLAETQPDIAGALDLSSDSPVSRRFLARLQGEISKRGVVDVLRRGIKHEKYEITNFYGSPSEGNEKAYNQYQANRFTVVRQLRYSNDETRLALDLALFINGLPIATFELKNNLTKQTVEDAVKQYKVDRDSREKLFEFGRCMVHFAVDDQEVRMCTALDGDSSWFLPFDRGWNDGAGNPPNPAGLKTDYLWKSVLSPDGLTDVIENYAQIVESKDPKTGKTKRTQIFPRYHQLDVVRDLLHSVEESGAGHRYLIQHSAGSGKSNSIAWFAHQLIGLRHDGHDAFDSVIVVTDRRNLDTQIRDTIRSFAQVGSTVGHAERAGDLRRFIESGKKIIISTVQKFPFIADEVAALNGSRFAVIIDEAHSSQGGKTAGAMNKVLGIADLDEDESDIEDRVNRVIEARKMAPNASYFAFTATPKNKTLQIFGEPVTIGSDTRYEPFHAYTMKQAIQEGFIMDVLKSYTPVDSYYRLVKTIDVDPEFDTKRAQKKLRKYVEGHDHAIRTKAEIMVDHFHEQVIAARKIGGEARAMIVCNGVDRAIQYFGAFNAYLAERRSPYKAIIAFSGEHEVGGTKVTESSLNGFASNKIEEEFQSDPYRFLICADKFQTGYDEPLLHTMYVDKTLSGIKAVQTLSRLNRAHPKKHDVFVLDFVNDSGTIRDSFADFYRTTILSDATDPNKLHDLVNELKSVPVFTDDEVEQFVKLFLDGVSRDRLDPILDACTARYVADLDEDQQVSFKGSAKSFTRTYDFLATVLPYGHVEWEKLSIFLSHLVLKLPAPKEEDFARGILESIDMDSYRVEKRQVLSIDLPDQDAEIGGVPMSGGGHRPEPEFDRLSNIVKSFNELFGNRQWTDEDRVRRMITEEIPERVAADPAYQNARQNNDRQNAKIEHDRALIKVMTGLVRDDTDLFKMFSDDPEFKRWLTNTVFDATYPETG